MNGQLYKYSEIVTSVLLHFPDWGIRGARHRGHTHWYCHDDQRKKCISRSLQSRIHSHCGGRWIHHEGHCHVCRCVCVTVWAGVCVTSRLPKEACWHLHFHTKGSNGVGWRCTPETCSALFEKWPAYSVDVTCMIHVCCYIDLCSFLVIYLIYFLFMFNDLISDILIFTFWLFI